MFRLYTDKEGFEHAKDLWLKQVDTYKGNALVLSNAIDFVLIQDKPLAERLLKQGAAAEPNKPQWRRRLGAFYRLPVKNESPEMRHKSAALSYEHYEQALKLTTDELEKFYLLSDLARSALEAREVESARTWAVELLKQAEARKQNWNYGNAIHHAQIVLGRIALWSGGFAEAKEHLVQAGKTPGSPQLNSFGPSMKLAKEFLEKGEREVVIQCFQHCSSFWRDRKLEEWTKSVQAGAIPNFGANLVY